MTELVVSTGSAKAVKSSKTMNKAFSKASSELKSVMGKAKKVVSTVSDEARELSRAARQATRKQLAKFRRPRRTVSRIDMEGLLKERGIPSTLSKEQRAACDAAGLEMKYKPSEAKLKETMYCVKDSECKLTRGIFKTVDDILEDAIPGRETKGKSQQWEKCGSYRKALEDYNALNPEKSRTIQSKYGEGEAGILLDGSKINVRPGSTNNKAPTLEIQKPNGTRIKIRYR